ncbi:MAG: hypothetical protein ACE5FD_04385 [Anaerolineae bacterium]
MSRQWILVFSLILAFAVPIPGLATAASFDLKVTYSNLTATGPLCLGLRVVPNEVDVTFRIAGDGTLPQTFTQADVLSAQVALGDLVRSESNLTSFSMETAVDPIEPRSVLRVTSLSYGFAPVDTATATAGIILNSSLQLTASGHCTNPAANFNYFWPDAAPVLTPISSVSAMDLLVEEAKAKLKLDKPNKDKVKVEGEFWLSPDPLSGDIALGTNAAGLRVIDEDITVKFDGRADFEQILPAGSLVETDLPNHYEYEPEAPNGPVLELEIEYVLGERHGKFEAKWKRRDLQALPAPSVENDLINSNPLLLAPVAAPFDLDIGNHNGVEAGINFKLEKDKPKKRVYEFEKEEDDEDAPAPADTPFGVPLSFDFRAGHFVSVVVFDVEPAWLTDPTWFLDVEITGLNGGFAHHGQQRLVVVDGVVFDDTNPVFSEVVFDWTTDTIFLHVNDLYTICSQVIHRVNGQATPVGVTKCVDFGPF